MNACLIGRNEVVYISVIAKPAPQQFCCPRSVLGKFSTSGLKENTVGHSLPDEAFKEGDLSSEQCPFYVRIKK